MSTTLLKGALHSSSGTGLSCSFAALHRRRGAPGLSRSFAASQRRCGAPWACCKPCILGRGASHLLAACECFAYCLGLHTGLYDGSCPAKRHRPLPYSQRGAASRFRRRARDVNGCTAVREFQRATRFLQVLLRGADGCDEQDLGHLGVQRLPQHCCQHAVAKGHMLPL